MTSSPCACVVYNVRAQEKQATTNTHIYAHCDRTRNTHTRTYMMVYFYNWSSSCYKLCGTHIFIINFHFLIFLSISRSFHTTLSQQVISKKKKSLFKCKSVHIVEVQFLFYFTFFMFILYKVIFYASSNCYRR